MFYSASEQKYCSSDCVSFSDESNPNCQGAKESTYCEICGNSFSYYPSEKPGLYCPTCVETENWRHRPDMTGANSPRWKGGKVELVCDVCESPFERHPSIIESDVTLCSKKCQHEWLSESFTADGHPNWEGGDTGGYGPGWNRVRRLALERDDYQCVLCGTPEEEMDRNPDVHHITPVREFVESDEHDLRDAHELENVVSLCIDCHRKADFGAFDDAVLRAKAEETG